VFIAREVAIGILSGGTVANPFDECMADLVKLDGQGGRCRGLLGLFTFELDVTAASVERRSSVTHEKDAGVDFIAREGAVGISSRQVVGSPLEQYHLELMVSMARVGAV
jgi:hypothetical protein